MSTLEPVFSQAPFDKKRDEENSKADLKECEKIYNSLGKIPGWIRTRCDSCGETRDCVGNLMTRRSICKVCKTLEIFKQKHGRDPR